MSTPAEECRAWLVGTLRFAPMPDAPEWLVSPDGWLRVLDPQRQPLPICWPWATLAEFQASTHGLVALKPPTWGSPAPVWGGYSFSGTEAR